MTELMTTPKTFLSRFAAMLLLALTVMHLVLALDLIFGLFQNSAELDALRAVAAGVKGLWLGLCAVGGAAVVALYRRPWLGFLLSVVFCACLYVASHQLWGEVKGGFWLAVAASLIAAAGASTSSSPSSRTLS
ncbi:MULTISPECIES: hypothetical protein [unclassified Lysobacter]|uniref:hypothetical protein n=1 Tax=unclassified Lysobacter TaxID=2635362 RepID=UPI0006FC167E|nr:MULTISPECIES: hypothetical protein [unclassified Lysobacter]KQZ60125.1 hypothetical protein ASD53_02920 [Lysobacter sp. Root559]KRC38568.1 hypothetical protein ASE10_03245 [Lysobacter sp. Root76]KRD71235.1 hypothetical protein ASE45_05235 [Lysobacter sp. Root96]HWU80938.1 hypothetical protein [Caulobacter sp.]